MLIVLWETDLEDKGGLVYHPDDKVLSEQEKTDRHETIDKSTKGMEEIRIELARRKESFLAMQAKYNGRLKKLIILIFGGG